MGCPSAPAVRAEDAAVHGICCRFWVSGTASDALVSLVQAGI